MYRFCNVCREDDKVTKWIHQHWLRPNERGFPDTLPMIMAVARMVNWTDTLHALAPPRFGWTDEYEARWMRVFSERREKGLKSWTSAYMITGGFSAGGESKEAIIARVLRNLWSQLQSNPIKDGDTLAIAAAKLRSPGIGSFLSAQIVADLKWAPPLREATDWDTWCAPGPGSTAGLAYLEGLEPKGLMPDEFRQRILAVRSVLEGEGILLDAQNVQNCMCEFSKYFRTKYRNGKPKTKYVQAISRPA